MCRSCFGQSIQLHDHRLLTAGSVLTERPPTRLGLDTPRRNSSDGLLHSVKFLLKQTMAKWKPKCKYSSSGFLHALALRFNQRGENNCQQEKWQPKPKPGCAGIWCSAEKQHNEVQITRRQISQEIAGGNMHNASW